MNHEEMKKNVKNNIRQRVAIANAGKEIYMNDLRNKKILYKIVPTCSCVILAIFCVVILNHTNLEQQEAKLKNEVIMQNDSENKVITANKTENISIAETLEKVEKGKIFYEKTNLKGAMLGYRPTIENLYKHSNIIVVGKYESDIDTYADGILIWTKTKFKVLNVIKNTTESEISEDIVIDRTGGVLTLDKYMDNNPTIREDEFTDIAEEDRKNYYVIQEFAPDNKLDLAKQGDSTEYVLFLHLDDNKITLCTSYYGMREIKGNLLYDYDTNEYISVENSEINEILAK